MFLFFFFFFSFFFHVSIPSVLCHVSGSTTPCFYLRGDRKRCIFQRFTKGSRTVLLWCIKTVIIPIRYISDSILHTNFKSQK